MNERLTKMVCLSIGLLCFIGAPVFAQSIEEPPPLRPPIQVLADGFLLVRLPSNHKKLEAMEEVMNRQNSPSLKERLATQILEVKNETQAQNYAIMQAFKQHFDFAPVYFAYDTAASLILSDYLEGYLLNDQLQVDPDLRLPITDFLTLRFGYTDPATTTRIEAMILTDRRFEELSAPFPAILKLNTFGYVTNKLLAPAGAYQKNMNRRVAKLNSRLKKYAERVKGTNL